MKTIIQGKKTTQASVSRAEAKKRKYTQNGTIKVVVDQAVLTH